MSRLILWALLFGLLSLPARAAYVTDQLLAGLYDRPETGGEPRQLLKSGTPLEVIGQQDDFSQVRLADGSEGWLESVYLTEDRPARHRVLMLQARVKELQRATQPQPAQQAAQVDDNGQDEQLRELAAELQQAHQQIMELKADTYHRTWPWPWPWVLAVLTLLVGFAAGVGVVERRLRHARR